MLSCYWQCGRLSTLYGRLRGFNIVMWYLHSHSLGHSSMTTGMLKLDEET